MWWPTELPTDEIPIGRKDYWTNLQIHANGFCTTSTPLSFRINSRRRCTIFWYCPEHTFQAFSRWDIEWFKQILEFYKLESNKYHFKILTKFKLQLTKDDLDLLNEMFSLAVNIIKVAGRKMEEFKIGYHAEPSLLQLHLHVISTDFHSPTLKTVRHYNSFNTKLFIPHQGEIRLLFCFPSEQKPLQVGDNHLHLSCDFFFSELVHRIMVHGKILKMDPVLVAALRQIPLVCHACHSMHETIQNLKSHLMLHLRWCWNYHKYRNIEQMIANWYFHRHFTQFSILRFSK